MKPLKLTVKNIASFTGKHTIDFSLLGDMFLICGKTGSGKTTVLDSLTYALYGSLPGSRKQNDIRRLRSDFCSAQEECFVELDFTLGGKTYRVHRTLPVSRVTRTGTITEDGESVELYRLDENKTELLGNQKNETDSFIQSLISLSVDEFSRIILLPQGEFAEFLRQKSSERKIMLSKLFPVERFTLTAERIKDEKNRLSTMLDEVLDALHRLEKTFSYTQVRERTAEYENRLKNALQTRKKLQNDDFKIQTEIRLLEERIGLYREYEATEAELQNLLSHYEEQRAREEKLQLLRFALSVEPLFDAAEKADIQLERMQKDFTDSQAQLENCTQRKKDLEKQKDGCEKNRKRIRELSLLIQNTEQALETAQELHSTGQELLAVENEIKNRLDEIRRINEELEPLQKIAATERELRENSIHAEQDFFAAEYIYLRAQENDMREAEKTLKDTAEKAQLILNDFLQERENMRKVSAAYFLAQNLENGKPCPVCGSSEHPQPAVQKEQALDSEEKIKTQQELCRQAEQFLREMQDRKKELQGRIAQSRESLVNFSQDFIAECEKKAECTGTASAEQNRINAQTKRTSQMQALAEFEKACASIRRCETELAIPQSKLGAAEKQKAATQAKFDHTKRQLNNLLAGIDMQIPLEQNQSLMPAIQNALNNLYSEQKSLERQVQTYEEQKAQTENAMAELSGKIDVLQTGLHSSEKEAENCRAALYASLANSAFDTDEKTKEAQIHTAERIRGVLKDKDGIQDLERHIEHYKTEKQRLEVLCAEKKASLSGSFEETEKKRLRLFEQKKETEQNLARIENETAEIQNVLADIRAKTEEYERLEKRRKKLFTELADYEKIHNAVSGKNPKKIQLESWILQMYLEEVCFYAGKRLERISDGRYTLYVKDADGGRGYRGLDLEIYDSHTGKRRPCSTLSGGETFMASVSLALAVSDTVQAKSGGVQLDALFIDEGFGSLDEVALEKALSVLDEIRGSRCIGLVSHVAALKTRIGSRLEIEKGLTGSKIKFENI